MLVVITDKSGFAAAKEAADVYWSQRAGNAVLILKDGVGARSVIAEFHIQNLASVEILYARHRLRVVKDGTVLPHPVYSPSE